MYSKITKRGFTLIELLVVIAIIGILAAVIMPTLNTARSKGKVAKFKSEMDSFRKQAELFYDNGSSTYTGLFANGTGADIATSTSHASVQDILNQLALNTPDMMIYGGMTTNGDGFALYGRIPDSDPNTLSAVDIWCVDSQSKAVNPSGDAQADFFTTNAQSSCW